MALQADLTSLPGIGPKKAALFSSLGVTTILDLLTYFPFRYDDLADLRPVRNWQDGEERVFCGVVVSGKETQTRNRMRIFKALLQGPQGELVATWFGRWNLEKKLSPGTEVVCFGRWHGGMGGELNVSRHEVVGQNRTAADFLRIEPVYPATERLSSAQISAVVEQGLKKAGALPNLLPDELAKSHDLLPWGAAVHDIHFPPTHADQAAARRTLAVYEFLHIILWARRTSAYVQTGIAHGNDRHLVAMYLASLPYELTNGQRNAIEDILADMSKAAQMHRLLQGDVGSGKTTVAVAALLHAVTSGHQGVIMAPTEVLARQHGNKILPALEALGVRAAVLTGSLKKSERNAVLEDVANGAVQVLIGTHALLEGDVRFQRLSLVIIDEQHRFGVRQRRRLEEKGEHPDLLIMTATPIPRSLAWTIYGDLDISVIRELPPGRQPIQTIWMNEKKRTDMYEFVRKELASGRQAYVVCPLVAESEKIDLANATALAEHLACDIYPEYTVGLLHGQMKPAEKAEIMADFVAEKIRLLVSTTVIEVGIDVGNATIMIVENAERFGLAQLHQLRGRVGRGIHKSYCILISGTTSKEGQGRMQAMVHCSDGFAIAEADLSQRGPGELLGVRQHGRDLFQLADPSADLPLIDIARRLAKTLESQPELCDQVAHFLNRYRTVIP